VISSPRAPSAPLHAATPPPQAAGTRAAAGGTAAGSEQDRRAARAPRPNGFSLCELPATNFSAAAPRSQPPARVRARAAALARRRGLLPSRGADLSPRISLQAAAFCARSLASASKPSKVVPNRHQTRLQHPSSCQLRVLAHPKLELASTPLLLPGRFLRSARPKESSLRVLGDVILQREQETRLIVTLAPKNATIRPHTSQSPTTDGKRRLRRRSTSPPRGARTIIESWAHGPASAT